MTGAGARGIKVRVFARDGHGLPGHIWAAGGGLGALALVAYVALYASESGDLCDRSLHAGWVEYELVDVQHKMDDGEFLGFCANKEYGVFDVFLDSEAGGNVLLDISKAEFDPRQVDHKSCDFGYSINGSASKHDGVRARQIYETDQRRGLQLSWDERVSQISYSKSPAACLEKYDVLERVRSAPPSSLQNLQYEEYRARTDAFCESTRANVIHLNYTISGGTLDRVCSVHDQKMVFYISPKTFGELIVDIPYDVFPPHTGAFEFHPVTGELVDAAYHRYPFTITTWNKYGIPYSTMELYHAEIQFRRTFEVVNMDNMKDQPDSFSRVIGCRDTEQPCFPIPFFWGRLAYKISSHDSFDRYSIPFRTDDVKIVLWVHNVLIPVPDDYRPEKYRMQESQEEFWRDLLRTTRAG